MNFHVSSLVYIHSVSRKEAFVNRLVLVCSPSKVRLALEMSAGDIDIGRIMWSEGVSEANGV